MLQQITHTNTSTLTHTRTQTHREVLPESVDKLAKHIAVTAMLPGGAAAAAAEAQRQKGRPASGNHHDDKHALRIVMFCNTGERSGANSIIMKERLNLPVRHGAVCVLDVCLIACVCVCCASCFNALFNLD